jgi:hypothetical protein
LNHKDEINYVSSLGMIDGNWDHHVKWNKPVSQRQLSCFPLYVEFIGNTS